NRNNLIPKGIWGTCGVSPVTRSPFMSFYEISDQYHRGSQKAYIQVHMTKEEFGARRNLPLVMSSSLDVLAQEMQIRLADTVGRPATNGRSDSKAYQDPLQALAKSPPARSVPLYILDT